MFRGVSLRRLLFALLVCTLVFGGIELRHWTWRRTKHLRYQHDIVNGFYWGSETLAQAKRVSPSQDADAADSWLGFTRGYLSLYDHVKGAAYERDYQLDYPPLRLLVMSIWAKQVHHDFPGAEDGKPEYVEPLSTGEFGLQPGDGGRDFFSRKALASACARCHAFALSAKICESGTRLDLCAGCSDSSVARAFIDSRFERLAAMGCLALAVLRLGCAGCFDSRWFWCGCLLAVGAMLKGQLLLVAPFFIFWPLWQKEWALRVARSGRYDHDNSSESRRRSFFAIRIAYLAVGARLCNRVSAVAISGMCDIAASG